MTTDPRKRGTRDSGRITPSCWDRVKDRSRHHCTLITDAPAYPGLLAPRRKDALPGWWRSPDQVCRETVVRPAGSGADSQLDPSDAAR